MFARHHGAASRPIGKQKLMKTQTGKTSPTPFDSTASRREASHRPAATQNQNNNSTVKNFMKSKLILAALAGTLFTTLAVAQPAVEWNGSENAQANGNFYTLGFRFKVTSASDIEAAALGAYDFLGNGLGSPHIVAIWPVGGGAPLATATIPAGVDTFLEGHFRYVSITPVRLFKNTEYVIGASGFGGIDPFAFAVSGFTNAQGVEAIEARSIIGSGLNFPTDIVTNFVGFFGGNFKFQSVPSVPHATLRFSQVEVCWTSESNKQYQVQYQSALTTNAWLNLGSPLPGTGTNTCVNDAIPRGQPQRFYRILGTPLP